MIVSFIIPHRGSEDCLEKTIRSIHELEYDKNNIEIIIVTKNAKLELKCINRTKTKIIEIKRPVTETISSLRNIGAINANGEYLAFIDSDVRLSANWINVMLSVLHEKNERILVGAIQKPCSDAGIIERIRVVINNRSSDSIVQFMDGRNLFMRKKTFLRSEGFPEDLNTCEDVYFTNKLTEFGKLYCTSQASYEHLGEDQNFMELFRKEMWRGQSNLYSLKGRKILLMELPSLILPFWELLFAVIFIITLFFDNNMFKILTLFLFILPPTIYSLRLYWFKERMRLPFVLCVWFYVIYFIARSLGSLFAIVKPVKG